LNIYREDYFMNAVNDNRWIEATKFIESIFKKTGIPGCCVGILHQGEFKTCAFGVSNIEKLSPVTEKTLFQIGSISKTFTATVAMKLVEENKLDLHKPVRSYLKDFKVADEAVSAQVTPYHLLTHSAGWEGDFFVETGDGEDAHQRYIQRMTDRQQLFPLGEYFSYNNAGFAVLGGILEAVTQKPIEALYRETIVGPLGLEHLFFNAAEAITYDFAVGHHASPEGNRAARPWRMPRGLLSMGGIVTDVGDLLHYAQCYLVKGKTPAGTQMLKPESITEMFTPKVTNNKDDRTSVGYSWMRRELKSGYLIRHGGGTNGQLTELNLLPEHDFALAIFTNGDQGGRLISEVQQYLLKTYPDAAFDMPKEIESTPEQLAAYAGTASRQGFKVHLAMMGRHLVGLDEETIGFPTENDPPPPPSQPFRVGRCAEDRLIILDGDGKNGIFDVFRDAEGKIQYIRAGRMYQFTPADLNSG
jgi:CubicO group peptidase (beta-lactamase class C family)